MKIKCLLCLPLIGFLFLFSCNETKDKSGKWNVVRDNSTGMCRCEGPSTAPPSWGTKIIGPFSNEEAAIKAMCENQTENPSDKKKCFDVHPSNACNE